MSHGRADMYVLYMKSQRYVYVSRLVSSYRWHLQRGQSGLYY